jgi:hypothetical protein
MTSTLSALALLTFDNRQVITNSSEARPFNFGSILEGVRLSTHTPAPSSDPTPFTALTPPVPAPIRTLIVGGIESFIRDSVAAKLARLSKNGRSIKMPLGSEWHWEYKRTAPDRLPSGCELVLVCTDMCGHDLSNKARELARDARIPCVEITRKFGETLPRLERYGYALVGALPEEDVPGTGVIPTARTQVDRGLVDAAMRAASERHLLANPKATDGECNDAARVAATAQIPDAVVPRGLPPAFHAECRARFGIRATGDGGVSITPMRYVAACRARGIPPSLAYARSDGTDDATTAVAATTAVSTAVAAPKSAPRPSRKGDYKHASGYTRDELHLISKRRVAILLRLMAAHPTWRKDTLSREVGAALRAEFPSTPFKLFVSLGYIATARRKLGIRATSGEKGAQKTYVYAEQYESVCAKLSITPNYDGTIRREGRRTGFGSRARPHKAQAKPRRGTQVESTNGVTSAKRVESPPARPPDDLTAAIRLAREEMAKAGVVSLSIGEDGIVSIRRRVVRLVDEEIV